MAISKEKKSAILARLADGLQDAVSVAFVGFNKLSVAETSAMRGDLKTKGVHYYVAKKTLIKRALETRGYAGTLPELPGEVAIAWSNDDLLAPARDLYEHGKKFKGGITLLGGVFEGTFADAEKMKALATIPPLPVLRGMFVNVINSPIQGLVVALDKISGKKAAI
jgi:large subunit ribosomal protein L10